MKFYILVLNFVINFVKGGPANLDQDIFQQNDQQTQNIDSELELLSNCRPSCQNGGVCLPSGTCQCPVEFRGRSCEYNAEMCNSHRLQFNGRLSCSGNDEGVGCALSCPRGAEFEFPPAFVYSCDYATGVFLPRPVPQCVSREYPGLVEPSGDLAFPESYSNLTESGGSDGFSQQQQEEVLLENDPQPGSCFMWSGSHFKSFDGKVYSFSSFCPYTLVKDGVDDTFSIMVRNNPECMTENENCYTAIKVYVENKEYFLDISDDDVPMLITEERVLLLPAHLPGIAAEISSRHIIIRLESLGVKVRWNGEQLIQVEVAEDLWNKTAGLCGKFDGEIDNDMVAKDGVPPKSIEMFAASWRSDSLGEECKDDFKHEPVCGDLRAATEFCETLLSDRKFLPCQMAVDISAFLESCVWDYCSCKGEPQQCACESVSVYVSECIQKGVAALASWRLDHECQIPCDNGKIYMPCGPKDGQAVCGGVVEKFDENLCEEGCYCPRGTYLHGSKCLKKEECPCMHHEKDYPPQATITKDCNTCTCVDGQWLCTQAECGTRCSIFGDPHYVTFDGKSYDFMGKCAYKLVEHENFTIELENVACGSLSSQASCPRTAIVHVAGQVIKIHQGRTLSINGQEIETIPYRTSGVTIRSISSMYLSVELPHDAKLWWDGASRLHIDVPASFKDQTKGLCGTFNKNQRDDFLTPEGDVEQSVIAFANKWKTAESCPDVPEGQNKHPCDINVQNKAVAMELCGVIYSDLFSDCYVEVDPEPFYQNCLYDLCACDEQLPQCLCPVVAAYGEECARKNIKADWRVEVKECGVQCPPGQTYQVCGNSCTRSCLDIAAMPGCKPECVEGCNCPNGETLENGECIPIRSCACERDGVEFLPGYKEIHTSTNGPQLCTCVNAQWSCNPATSEDVKAYPDANSLKSSCSAAENEEFTACEPAEPMTCKNMHSFEEATTAVCRPGCRCKAGHVLDSSSKKCVKPAECPCHHSRKSYNENESVQDNCNVCTCQEGKWKCTDKPCSGECSTWGDSHYKSFDGRWFDFQGQCDYVLAKSTKSDHDGFEISTQNVACSSLGVSCSKSVTIRVGTAPYQESVTLSRDKKLPEDLKLKHLVVRRKDHFVIVDAPEHKFVVHWDRGTRIYVKLDSPWKSKVQGLCGNYNDNERDDFQTPSGGITETSAQVFGDSWRMQPYCSKAFEILDTCEEKPDRKVWALKKCNVLKSPPFEKCHAEVPIEEYLQRCIFDTCACDQGGDCQCLCTALAAYAHECNSKGVPVKWRTPDLCPIQCDERCSRYSPCISPCPVETCDNLLSSGLTMCEQDTCLEGCEVKPCPPSFIYSNSSYLECVPKSSCKPPCLREDGVEYFEGDVMEEDLCHTCHCSRGKRICQGQPCTTTPLPRITEVPVCEPGWTEWINQDKHDTGKSTFDDIEPLPDSVTMNNLVGSRCNSQFVTDIQCRTADTHQPFKDTLLDVECSLERGLVCKSTEAEGLCVDFEIRVKCDCAPTTTPTPKCDVNHPAQEHPSDCHLFYYCTMGEKEPELVQETCGSELMFNTETLQCDAPENVVKIKPECQENQPPCPPGKEYRNCSARCDQMCSYYLHQVKREGYCREGNCLEGCASASKALTCPPGTLWANEDVCVPEKDCLCVSHTGQPVKPGSVVKESACEVCQCVHNFYTCDRSACETPSTLPAAAEPPTTPNVLIMTSTVTPPGECKEENFINLVNDDIPLPDEAFTASSSLKENSSPERARLNAHGAVWVPETSEKGQYLQIDLGRQEPIYGVITAGDKPRGYVTSYKILYSPNDQVFTYVTDAHKQPKLFRGSLDGSPLRQVFNVPIEAKLVRILPETWHDFIALQVELIGCGEFSTEAPTTTGPMCDDTMGLDDGEMDEQQVTVSSELKPLHGKDHLKLSSENAWQPVTDFPLEWVQFNFLEPRNVTGVKTKGGPDGWVTAFHVKYSHNGREWNPILDSAGEEQLFLGNVDGTTPHVVHFSLPIQATFLKIMPVKWHERMQLKVEPIGCFVPYPPVEATTTAPPCNCPGVLSDSDVCKCGNELWWNGEECVTQAHCPCVVGYMSYPVGSVFEDEDCSHCVCKLGGVTHCTPKSCETCGPDLRSQLTSTCECVCRPCEDGMRLCPTSGICIDATDWCNGVKDCPDDETDCFEDERFLNLKPVTPAVSEFCPPPYCPQGYKIVMTKRQVQEQQSVKKSENSKRGFKFHKKPKVSEAESECPAFECLPRLSESLIPTKEPCPEITCPPGYSVEKSVVQKGVNSCPRYECKPLPVMDAVCNVTGRTFNTFDNSEYKYDPCHHILAKDLKNNQWEIIIKKNCVFECSPQLTIRVLDDTFELNQDLSAKLNGYNYTMEQVEKIGLQEGYFSVNRVGDSVAFFSKDLGFWAIWNKQGAVKVGVSRKLLDTVNGLCGYFNDNYRDDKTKPDGSLAKTSEEFGDSWAVPHAEVCEEMACPVELQEKAWKMCNLVREDTFLPCVRGVDLDSFVSHCLETACACLESTKATSAEEKCRCDALQSFVADCLALNADAEIDDWRIQYDCPSKCDLPFVHQDCYRRRCEPSCELSQINSCPKLAHLCFPGCYCPEGYIRKEDTCILPTGCKDCECNLMPHMEYVTFDESSFVVNGNCVYVMARDVLTKDNEHRFQVLTTNHPCEENNKKMCIGKLTILYKGHKVHILRNPNGERLVLIADQERILDYSDVESWAHVEEDPQKNLKILLKDEQVQVSVYYPSLGVSVKAPSHKYRDKLEGICGNCNGDASDDLKLPNGELATNPDEFGPGWLYAELPGGQTKEQCQNVPETTCKEIPEWKDPCAVLESAEKFGQCHALVDPGSYIEWCRKDTCNEELNKACAAIEAYSSACVGAGVCVDWHVDLCPPPECPHGQEYKLCGPSCPQTCDALKEKETCEGRLVEGCFCPEGKVLLNGTCVPQARCEICDDDGHRSGDIWQVDVCTTCMCEGNKVLCEVESCPSVETVCEEGHKAKKISSADACCEKYMCVHAPSVASFCEAAVDLECGFGQVKKLVHRPNGCMQLICECKPSEDCEPVDAQSANPAPGFVAEIDSSGCCPKLIEKCEVDTCPPPPTCPQFYTLGELPGECCPDYNCLRPKKCIVELAYAAGEEGGERPRHESERQKVLKQVNEKWQDGPCRSCRCVEASTGDFHDVCSKTDCPPASDLDDYADFEFEKVNIPGKCCPAFKKVSCKDENKVHGVGEKWPVSGEPCQSVVCEETPNGLQKVLHVATCNTNCAVGQEYQQPPIHQCCGSCQTVACVVDGALHDVGAKWHSLDYCTYYSCVDMNGNIEVSSVQETCPAFPTHLSEDYVVEASEVGKCCKNYTKVACLDNGHTYKIGETWTSEDNKCKTTTCVQNKDGDVTKQGSIETCHKNCSLGWEYKESDTQCCGECVQVGCIFDNMLKHAEEAWNSSDECTTFSCASVRDQFVIATHMAECPVIDQCPEDQIYVEGCCKRCKLTSDSLADCAASELKSTGTIGLVTDMHYQHGKCENKEPLRAFTECTGTCKSFTSFSSMSGQHESTCFCCKILDYKEYIVELECEDGYKLSKKIDVPRSCGCQECGPASQQFKNFPQVNQEANPWSQNFEEFPNQETNQQSEQFLDQETNEKFEEFPNQETNQKFEEFPQQKANQNLEEFPNQETNQKFEEFPQETNQNLEEFPNQETNQKFEEFPEQETNQNLVEFPNQETNQKFEELFPNQETDKFEQFPNQETNQKFEQFPQETNQNLEAFPNQETNQKFEEFPQEINQNLEEFPNQKINQKFEQFPQQETNQNLEEFPNQEANQKFEELFPNQETNQKFEQFPNQETNQKFEEFPQETNQNFEQFPEEINQNLEKFPNQETNQNLEEFPNQETNQKFEEFPQETNQNLEQFPEEINQNLEKFPNQETNQNFEEFPNQETNQKFEPFPPQETNQNLEEFPNQETNQKFEELFPNQETDKFEQFPNQETNQKFEQFPQETNQNLEAFPNQETNQNFEGFPQETNQNLEEFPNQETNQKFEEFPNQETNQKFEPFPQQETNQNLEAFPNQETNQKFEEFPQEINQNLEEFPNQKINQKFEQFPQQETNQNLEEFPNQEANQKFEELFPNQETNQKFEQFPNQETNQKFEEFPQETNQNFEQFPEEINQNLEKFPNQETNQNLEEFPNQETNQKFEEFPQETNQNLEQFPEEINQNLEKFPNQETNQNFEEFPNQETNQKFEPFPPQETNQNLEEFPNQETNQKFEELFPNQETDKFEQFPNQETNQKFEQFPQETNQNLEAFPNQETNQNFEGFPQETNQNLEEFPNQETNQKFEEFPNQETNQKFEPFPQQETNQNLEEFPNQETNQKFEEFPQEINQNLEEFPNQKINQKFEQFPQQETNQNLEEFPNQEANQKFEELFPNQETNQKFEQFPNQETNQKFEEFPKETNQNFEQFPEEINQNLEKFPNQETNQNLEEFPNQETNQKFEEFPQETNQNLEQFPEEINQNLEKFPNQETNQNFEEFPNQETNQKFEPFPPQETNQNLEEFPNQETNQKFEELFPNQETDKFEQFPNQETNQKFEQFPQETNQNLETFPNQETNQNFEGFAQETNQNLEEFPNQETNQKFEEFPNQETNQKFEPFPQQETNQNLEEFPNQETNQKFEEFPQEINQNLEEFPNQKINQKFEQFPQQETNQNLEEFPNQEANQKFEELFPNQETNQKFEQFPKQETNQKFEEFPQETNQNFEQFPEEINQNLEKFPNQETNQNLEEFPNQETNQKFEEFPQETNQNFKQFPEEINQNLEKFPNQETNQNFEEFPNQETNQKFEPFPQQETNENLEGFPNQETNQKFEPFPQQATNQNLEEFPNQETNQKIEEFPQATNQNLEEFPNQETNQKFEEFPQEINQNFEQFPEEINQNLEKFPNQETNQNFEEFPNQESNQKFEEFPQEINQNFEQFPDEINQNLEKFPNQETNQNFEEFPNQETNHKFEPFPQQETNQNLEEFPNQETNQKFEEFPQEINQNLEEFPNQETNQKFEEFPQETNQNFEQFPEETNQNLEKFPNQETNQNFEEFPNQETNHKFEPFPQQETNQNLEEFPNQETNQKFEEFPQEINQNLEEFPNQETNQKFEEFPQETNQNFEQFPEETNQNLEKFPNQETNQDFEEFPNQETNQKFEEFPNQETNQKFEEFPQETNQNFKQFPEEINQNLEKFPNQETNQKFEEIPDQWSQNFEEFPNQKEQLSQRLRKRGRSLKKLEDYF